MNSNSLSPRAERGLTTGTTLLFVATLVGAIMAFMRSTGRVVEPFAQGFDLTILIVIFVNAFASLAAVIYVYRHLGTMDAQKAFKRGAVALLSVVWDVVAIGLLFSTAESNGFFTYLGIVLVIDLITDAWVHIKR